MVPSFFDELEKIAVLVTDLYRAQKRIGMRRPPKGAVRDLYEMVGAGTTPTRAQQRAANKMKKPPAKVTMVRKALPPKMLAEVEEYAKANPGAIYVSPRVGNIMLKNPTKRDMRRMRAVAQSHESEERKARFSTKSMHADEGVLAKDMNLINRAEGPLRETTEKMRATREATGEIGYLRRRLRRVFKDKRVEQFMEPGAKIPKAMRRRLERAKGRAQSERELLRSSQNYMKYRQE